MPIIKPGPYDLAERDLEQNFDNLKDHVEDKDFKLWLSASTFQDNKVGAPTTGAYVASFYWNLQDAATTAVVAQHYRPAYWTLGKVSMKVFYTGSVGSTNNCRMLFRMSGFIENGTSLATAGGDVTATETVSIPGPAVADEVISYTVTQANWLALTATYPYLMCSVTRIGADAADTYAGSFRLLGAVLQFYPTRR